MPTAIKYPAPVTVNFADDGTIPNNPTLPLVLHRNGIDLAGTPDPERLIEKTFAANGWGDVGRRVAQRHLSVRALSLDDPRGARRGARARHGALRRR